LPSSTKFLAPEFRQALREKCFSYLLATEQAYDATGKRIKTKDLIADPIFRAIHYYRDFYLAQEALHEVRQIVPDLTSREPDPKQTQLLVSELLRAIGIFDQPAVQRVLVLMGLNERCRINDNFLQRTQQLILPWAYYIGTAAFIYLTDQTVPTKEDVIELALQLRTRDCLPARVSRQTLQEKVAEVRKTIPKQWRRIFREVGLTDLLPR
jgi:hypothetical protein